MGVHVLEVACQLLSDVDEDDKILMTSRVARYRLTPKSVQSCRGSMCDLKIASC